MLASESGGVALFTSDDVADPLTPKPKPKRLPKPKKRAVLGVLMLEEFLKELAAIAVAHAVLARPGFDRGLTVPPSPEMIY